jgi:hypothetical protein
LDIGPADVFRPRSGHAGAGLAKLLGFLCPMLLVLLLLLRAFLPLPEPMRWLWAATAILAALSGAVALILLMIGPWQNRLAGFVLCIVVGALLLVREPAYAWAAQFSRML